MIMSKDEEPEQSKHPTDRFVDRTKIELTGDVTEDVMPKVQIIQDPS